MSFFFVFVDVSFTILKAILALLECRVLGVATQKALQIQVKTSIPPNTFK